MAIWDGAMTEEETIIKGLLARELEDWGLTGGSFSSTVASVVLRHLNEAGYAVRHQPAIQDKPSLTTRLTLLEQRVERLEEASEPGYIPKHAKCCNGECT
jgi:hypothetical protein